MKQFFQKLLGTRRGKFWAFLLTLTLLALFFQLVHFGEHIAQAVAWIFGYRNAPYMTQVGHYLMHLLGDFFYPTADHAFQEMMGNEILHLIGNAIYAFGTVALLFFLRTKLTILAAIIESFHLYEHICLTLSAAISGTPIGASTMWGLPMEHTTAVAFRVWWHFFMNAIPTVLTVLALLGVYFAVRHQLQKK